VAVSDDGVTLTVDLARADLLLETEIGRFAQPLPGQGDNGQRVYRLTPASLAAARSTAMSRLLEEWFLQRTGQTMPAAARLLLMGPDAPPLAVGNHVVLEVPYPEVADGLLQWPETRGLIHSRLGPCALSVGAESLPALRRRMEEIGLRLKGNEVKGSIDSNQAT
jgi:hypothetical protein